MGRILGKGNVVIATQPLQLFTAWRHHGAHVCSTPFFVAVWFCFCQHRFLHPRILLGRCHRLQTLNPINPINPINPTNPINPINPINLETLQTLVMSLRVRLPGHTCSTARAQIPQGYHCFGEGRA